MTKQLARFLSVLSLLLPLAVSAAALTPESALLVSSGVSEAFDASTLERTLGLTEGELRGVTVSSLPDGSAGRLICEGVEVEAFDYLPREALDWFVFESFSDETAASFFVLPDTGEVSETCTLSILSEETPADPVSVANGALLWQRVQNHYFSSIDVMAASYGEEATFAVQSAE